MPQIVAYYLNNQVRTLRDEINMRKQCASKWKESINEFIDAAIMFPQLRIRNHDNWCYTVALVDEKLWNPIYNICSKLGTNFYGAWALTYKELPFQNIGMHNCRNAEKLHDKLIQLPIGGDRTRDIENFHKAVKTVLDTH
jgi:dTDP-4-amino-4,6-dideoxygalactose transaminase